MHLAALRPFAEGRPVWLHLLVERNTKLFIEDSLIAGSLDWYCFLSCT
jgi:hypothetical protein